MSRRPLLHPIGRLAKAQDRMAPGGRVWSESPIPRKFSPRVPMLGEEPALLPCSDPTFDPSGMFGIVAGTPTTATFAPTDAVFGFTSLIIQVRVVAAVSGPVGVRVASILPDPGDPPTDFTPTGWQTVTGPGAGSLTFSAGVDPVASAGTISGWVVEWDVPDAFTSLCSKAADAT